MPTMKTATPEEASEYEKRRLKREAKAAERQARKLSPELRDQKAEALKKAREVRGAKMAARHAIEEKVRLGMPITEEERDMLNWRGGRISKRDQKKLTLAAAANLVIKSKSVNELRLLVEQTAANLHYNPIEKLIQLGNDANTDLKDKIAIHKSLLPYLAPQLASPKAEPADHGKREVKVTITNFVFPAKDTKPLHTMAPAVVKVEQDQTSRLPPLLRD